LNEKPWSSVSTAFISSLVSLWVFSNLGRPVDLPDLPTGPLWWSREHLDGRLPFLLLLSIDCYRQQPLERASVFGHVWASRRELLVIGLSSLLITFQD
jgi:hypothetical protein